MISQEFMFCQFDVKSQDELFDKLSDQLIRKEMVDDGFSTALKVREQEFPTGLPVKHGVAIPHTDGKLVKRDQLLFVTLKTPIVFNEMGGDDDDIVSVNVVIMLAVKDGKRHLEVLQNLIESIQKEGFVDGLVSSKNEEEMKAIITSYL